MQPVNEETANLLYAVYKIVSLKPCPEVKIFEIEERGSKMADTLIG
jgi:hypothetical protein